VSRYSKPQLLAFVRALQVELADGLAASLLETGAQLPSLVVGFFQHRSYFLAEQERLATYGALGVTTIVGFPGAAAGLGPGITHFDLSGCAELEDSWVFAIAGGACTAVLVAIDDKGLVPGSTLEASRRFAARSSTKAGEVLPAIRQLLAPLRAHASPAVLTRIDRAIEDSERAVRNTGDAPARPRLEAIANALDAVPFESSSAERDPLTGLADRRFLLRYLPSAPISAARVVALAIDVDDLDELNGRLGRDAGDRALVAVATALCEERRPGEVLVRYGEDKFLMLASLGRGAGALQIAERLVAAVRGARLGEGLESEQLTVSVGATVADPARLPMVQLWDAVRLAKLFGKDAARLVD
jgi:diguanylate cyclase (GGDEF)-like protein